MIDAQLFRRSKLLLYERLYIILFFLSVLSLIRYSVKYGGVGKAIGEAFSDSNQDLGLRFGVFALPFISLLLGMPLGYIVIRSSVAAFFRP